MAADGSQPELVAANGRRFAGFAAAVLVFIIDPATRRFLLLSSPAKRCREGWENVSGGLEGGETLIEGVMREDVFLAADGRTLALDISQHWPRARPSRRRA